MIMVTWKLVTGKCGKSWVKYKTRVKRFVNKKYIVPGYLETMGSYDDPKVKTVQFPPRQYTYRWKKIENDDTL